MSSTLVHCADGLAIAECGPVCVALWRSAVTPTLFETQRECLAEVVRKHRGEVGFLCVVEPSAEAPSDELRRASAKMVTDHGADLKCVACVIEGSGFRAAVTRSVVSAMFVLIRTPSPVKTFASVGAAVAWMSGHLSIGPTAPFVRKVENARQSLPPPPLS